MFYSKKKVKGKVRKIKHFLYNTSNTGISYRCSTSVMIIITKVNVENLSLFMGQYTALIMGNIQHVSSSGRLY